MAEESIRTPYERRLAALKSERAEWEPEWKDLRDYIMPYRGRFSTNERAKPRKTSSKIIDLTGTFAAQTLASGMMSGVTSPARPWFRLATQDPDLVEFGPVKDWLFLVESVLRRVFLTSNVYTSLHNSYEEIGTFGTAALCIEDDFDDIIRAYPYTVGEYMFATSRRLSVNTMYREFQLTVAQMVEAFGDSVSPTVKNLYDHGTYHAWVDVCHGLEPNTGRDLTRADARNMPYRSVYWEKGAESDAILRSSGYEEFPVMGPRWNVAGSQVYGYSPGMVSIGDIKALQTMEKRAAQAIDKMVNPALVGPSALKNAATSVLPGAMNFDDTTAQGRGLRPIYEVNPRLAEFNIKTEETRSRINRAFFADLFLMLANGDPRTMTATEVSERHEEKLLALGPVLGRLDNELYSPLIDRAFAIVRRHSEAGWRGLSSRMLIPPPPKELHGQDLVIEYISILHQAQKAVATGGVERFAGFVGNLAAVKPEVLDKVDFDQAVDEYADALGVSPRIVVPDERVAEIRNARAQQQRAAAAAQAGMAAVQGAKVLSETDTSGGNVLSDVLGVAK